MAITPKDIEQQTFSAAKKGYNTEEVDDFLERLADEVGSMIQKIADLKGRLNSAEQELALARAQAQAAPAPASAVPAVAAAPAVKAVNPATLAVSEQQLSRALIAAQQSAEKTVADANAAAESIRAEADAQAREVVRQVLGEKQLELDEINRLKRSRESFANEYKAMLQKFMSDAEAAFAAQTPAPSTDSPNKFSDYGTDAPAAVPAETAPEASATSAAGTAPAVVPVADPFAATSIFGDLD